MKITVNVTAEHIERSRELQRSTNEMLSCICPVALAGQEALKLSRHEFYVSRASIDVKIPVEPCCMYKRLSVPETVKTFISAFDYGGIAEPFSFELDVP